jgi:2-(1,2-epoxy-1,2-dihydrophenyl)acetyl-CoA isomerase
MEMSMLGDAVDAEEAYRIELVGRVVPDEWLEEKEAVGQTFCGRTADHEEGIAAFFEKREPNFTGR